jgi:hypothetical protein
MPTETEFANDLNLDATDTAQITNKLAASVHFLTKIDARLTRIDQVLVPSPPPITPQMKDSIVSIVALTKRILATSQHLDSLPVQDGGLGDTGGG